MRNSWHIHIRLEQVIPGWSCSFRVWFRAWNAQPSEGRRSLNEPSPVGSFVGTGQICFRVRRSPSVRWWKLFRGIRLNSRPDSGYCRMSFSRKDHAQPRRREMGRFCEGDGGISQRRRRHRRVPPQRRWETSESIFCLLRRGNLRNLWVQPVGSVQVTPRNRRLWG